MFDPKRFDPLSPSLQRLLDQQKKRERLLYGDRLSNRYAWITKLNSPLFQAAQVPSPLMGVLADLQKSQDRLTAFTAGPSVWADLQQFAPSLGTFRGTTSPWKKWSGCSSGTAGTFCQWYTTQIWSSRSSCAKRRGAGCTKPGNS